jgi:hypothetical protein
MNARQYKFHVDEFKQELTVEQYFLRSEYFIFFLSIIFLTLFHFF